VVFLPLMTLFWLLASGHRADDEAIIEIAGGEGIICGFSAICPAAVEVFKDTYGKEILPIGEIEWRDRRRGPRDHRRATLPPMHVRAAAVLLAAALVISAVPAAADDGPFVEEVSVIWTGAIDGCQYERLLVHETRGETLDIAMVGSSLAFRGMHSAEIVEGLGDPAALVQNAALPGKPIDTFRWWAMKVLVPIARPEVVVIGVASRDLIVAGAQQTAASRKLTESLGREFTARGDLQYALDRIAAGIRIPTYRAALRRPDLVTDPLPEGWDPDAAGFVAPGWQQSNLWRSNCQQIRDREAEIFTGSTAAQRDRLRDNQLLPWDLTAGLTELSRLVRALQRNGVTPVVVNLPVTPDYISAHPNGQADYDAYRAAVEAIAVEEQILLIDAVEYFTVDQGVFRDMTHLNKWGARRLSRNLGRLLKHPAAARVVCLRCD